MDLTHNPHLRDIDHALSAEVNASQRQRVALPPFDSLRDGDIVTLQVRINRGTYKYIVDGRAVDTDDDTVYVDFNADAYETIAIAVERAS